MKRTVLPFSVILILSLAAISCEQLDVVRTGSVISFDKVLQQIPQSVAPDETNGGWSLTAPDGAARFIWSRNYAESPLHNIMLEIDAAPFLAAGLDPSRVDGWAFAKVTVDDANGKSGDVDKLLKPFDLL
jgi:hypothetical protein